VTLPPTGCPGDWQRPPRRIAMAIDRPLRLVSPTLALTVHPDLRWDLAPRHAVSPSISGACLMVGWLEKGRRRTWRLGPGGWHVEQGERALERHGRGDGVRLTARVPDSQLEVSVEWLLPFEHDLALWRMTFRNGGADPVELHQVSLLAFPDAQATGQAGGVGVQFGEAGHRRLAWLSDGWQSWSFSGVVSGERFVTGTRLGPLTSPMYLNPSTGRPRSRRQFSSDLFGALVDRTGRRGLVVGQISERQAFAGLTADLNPEAPVVRLTSQLDGARLEPSAAISTDWAALSFVELDRADPLAAYLEAVARENGARTGANPPAGWCSWYYYFDNVRQQDIERNVAWMTDHRDHFPLELVQLDDGFQPEVGDWLVTNGRFPQGHKALVTTIKRAGQLAGLWLAPFIAKPGAELVRRHPDWLLRRPDGRPVRAGYNWNTFTLALDVTHPAVLEHAGRLIRKAVEEWGYRYLKLDFLYAAALPGCRYDPTATRASALRHGLEVIRRAAGDEVLLAACGCPLGPAVGLVDSMRIGADVAPRWRPAYQGIEFYFSREPSLPSTRNAVHNTLTRSHLHDRWWLNDPDCILLRSSDTHLNPAEAELLATVVSLSGGTLMLSDDMPRLSKERLALLARLLPPIPGRPQVPDLFERLRPARLVKPMQGALGRWVLAAVINWEDRPADRRLDLTEAGFAPGDLVETFDIWQRQPLGVVRDGIDLTVPPHGVRLLRLQSLPGGPIRWVGDDLHVSSGGFVKSWQTEPNHALAQLDLGRQGQGSVWLRIPSGRLEAAVFDDEPIVWQGLLDDLIRVDLPPFRRAELRLQWLS